MFTWAAILVGWPFRPYNQRLGELRIVQLGIREMLWAAQKNPTDATATSVVRLLNNNARQLWPTTPPLPKANTYTMTEAEKIAAALLEKIDAELNAAKDAAELHALAPHADAPCNPKQGDSTDAKLVHSS